MKYVKQFFVRGMLFGGFGPIIAAIVHLILHYTLEGGVLLTGTEMFTAVVSTYLLAFVHAGVSVFNQIENWSIMRSLFFHFLSLYAVYVLCYLVNNWIPYSSMGLLIFTGVFVAIYFVVWGIVYGSVKASSRKMSRRLQG